jgi:hypothetical protein
MTIVISDFMLAVVRISAVIAITIVFLSMLTSFRVAVKTADVERTAYELGEGFIGGGLALERGIVDETKLSDWPAVAELDAAEGTLPPTVRRRLLLSPRPEPVRHCLIGARYVVRDSQKMQVAATGMMAAPTDSESATIRFPIWLSKAGALRPAELEITTYLSPVTRVLCAAEQAWVEGKAEIEAACPFEFLGFVGGCDLFTDGDKVCIRDECRVMGIEVSPVSWDGGDKLRFTRSGNTVKAEVIG